MTSDLSIYFNTVVSKDLLDLCTDKAISQGSTRSVYKSALAADEVLKFETSARRFQNILEWETWQIVQYFPKHKRWFVPCVSISDCGTILIQKYARDLEESELLAELPVYFADIKRENFGMFNGQVVCRDYGNTFLIDRGFNTTRMKKADW